MRKVTPALISIVLAAAFGFCPSAKVDSAVPPAADNNQAILRKLTAEAQQLYVARDYLGAAAKYQQATKLLKGTPPKVQIVLYSNLGAALREAKQFPQAEQALKSALDIADRIGADKDPMVIVTMKQYVVLLRKMGKTVDADVMESRALGSVAATSVSRPGTKAALTLGDPAGVPTDVADKVLKVDQATIDVRNTPPNDIRKLIDQDPNSPTLWLALALRYAVLKEWSNACPAFSTLAARSPKLYADYMEEHAVCLSGNNQPQEAIEVLRRAIEAKPNDAELYLRLHDVYMSIGDVRTCIETDQTFVDKFPDHPKHSAVAKMLDYEKKDVDKQKVTDGQPPSKWEQVHNWPNRMMPLKVWVNSSATELKFHETSSNMTESNPTEIMNRACSLWNQASQGRVGFKAASDAADADIEISFTEDPDGMEQEFAAGVTTWAGYGEKPRATIVLLTVHGQSQEPYSREEFLETCLHELGHALGMEHSQNLNDVMYPSKRGTPLSSLSDNDAKRLVRLYTR